LVLCRLSSNRNKNSVPPHLRNQAGGGPRDNVPDNASSGSGPSSGGGYGNRGGRGYDGRSQRGSYGGGRGGYDAPPSNVSSRWSGVQDDRRGSGYGGGGSGGGGYGQSRGPRRNERGYHGDMRPDKRLERQLFERDIQQTSGINFDNYDNIPVETSGSDVPDPIEVYSAEVIGEDLFRNVQLCGYTKPTPVQKWSIPIASANRDLMACAQTGSGKTAGFLFPIIITMLRNGGSEPEGGPRGRRTYPECLVLAPTRELASQIQDEAQKFLYCTGIASVVVYGGADVRDQLRQIERGCDLLVATPGRLVDLIERGRLGMENVKFLVLDEVS
jgi:ATP-dependent RNA helicase DDX3X